MVCINWLQPGIIGAVAAAVFVAAVAWLYNQWTLRSGDPGDPINIWTRGFVRDIRNVLLILLGILFLLQVITEASIK